MSVGIQRAVGVDVPLGELLHDHSQGRLLWRVETRRLCWIVLELTTSFAVVAIADVVMKVGDGHGRKGSSGLLLALASYPWERQSSLCTLEVAPFRFSGLVSGFSGQQPAG